MICTNTSKLDRNRIYLSIQTSFFAVIVYFVSCVGLNVPSGLKFCRWVRKLCVYEGDGD